MTPIHHRLPAAMAIMAALLLAADQSPAQHVPSGLSGAEARRILGARFPALSAPGLPDKCGVPLIAAAIHNRSSLSPREATALASLLDRTERQTSVVAPGGLFRIHFDTVGTEAPALLDAGGIRIPGTARAFVDSAAAIINNVYQVETGTLGFHPPPGDGGLGGGAEYDIYIHDLSVYGSGTYGLTTPDAAVTEGGTSSTYIEVDKDFSFVTPGALRGIPSLRVTLAHEFHHAIQIGTYGFWTNDVWFHEITSVWMEDVVYHGENDYLGYLFSHDSQFSLPGTPLTSNDFIMYSRGILGKFFTKRYGANTMRHMWENIRTTGPLAGIDLTLHQLPSPLTTSLGVAFAEWALWNYYTGPRADSVNYYTESALFPVMTESFYDLISPSQQVSGSLLCLTCAYDGFGTGTDTVTVALVNMNAVCPSGGQTASPYTLTVSRNKPDDSYRAIAGGLYQKLDVTNPSQWVSWSIGGQGPIGSSVREGSAFPNPYRPGDGGLLFIPADADGGTVAIYSSGMELVYSASITTQRRLGQRVFAWNGTTNGNSPAPTGVYVFMLTLPDRTVTGKFALVRR